MLAGTVATQGHYFVFLIFPLALVAVRIAARPTALRVGGFLLLILALNDMDPHGGPLLDRHIYLKIICNNMPLYGLLALGVFLVRAMLSNDVHERHRDGRRNNGI